MRSKQGYTLMEILIVIVLLSVLATGLTALLDPLEQIRRAQDSAVFLLMKDIHGALARTMTQDGGAPWSEELNSVSLVSPSGQAVMDALMNEREFQKDTYEANKTRLGTILLSAPRDGTMYQICYKPVAKGNYNSKDNRYDSSGIPVDGCPNKDCFTCLFAGNTMKVVPTVHFDIPVPTATTAPTNTPSPTPKPTATPAPTVPPGCLNFDPEYPTFAWTCNYSTKWEKYGCWDYCVVDMGCGGGKCKSDERRLQKRYTGDWMNNMQFVCLEHMSETTEDYCISGREANCGYKNYPSDSTYDYHWGCTNPRRPYEWVQYQ